MVRSEVGVRAPPCAAFLPFCKLSSVHDATGSAIFCQNNSMNKSEMSFSSAQCRAARGLLNLSQSTVAELAHIAPATLSEFERDDRVPSYNNLQAIRAALETAGIVFIPANGGGQGARLRVICGGNVPGEIILSRGQCRAARYLLKLSQQDLADAAGIARSTVAEFERSARAVTQGSLVAMRSTLEAAGVVFIDANGGGPGLRLRD